MTKDYSAYWGEVNELAIKAKNDAGAMDELVSKLKPYVRKIATDFSFKYNLFEETEDLLQEGLIGAIKAVGDYSKEVSRFSTYVTHRIVGSILHYIRDKIS